MPPYPFPHVPPKGFPVACGKGFQPLGTMGKWSWALVIWAAPRPTMPHPVQGHPHHSARTTSTHSRTGASIPYSVGPCAWVCVLAAGACKGPPSKSDPWPLAGLGPTSIKNWGAVGTGRDRGEGLTGRHIVIPFLPIPFPPSPISWGPPSLRGLSRLWWVW